jgi:hypothetical protein
VWEEEFSLLGRRFLHNFLFSLCNHLLASQEGVAIISSNGLHARRLLIYSSIRPYPLNIPSSPNRHQTSLLLTTINNKTSPGRRFILCPKDFHSLVAIAVPMVNSRMKALPVFVLGTLILQESWLIGGDSLNGFLVTGFISQSKVSFSPVISTSHRTPWRRPYGYHATTMEKQQQLGGKPTNGDVADVEAGDVIVATTVVNGDFVINVDPLPLSTETTTTTMSDFNASHISDLLDEITRRINDGSNELLQNITNAVDEQMAQLPESAAEELTGYLADLANKIRKAQEEEVQRQMEELEKLFVAPLERVAFSDAPLFEMDTNKNKKDEELKGGTLLDDFDLQSLVLAGANSTLTKSARMRTSELIKNFNVAPMYYSVALLYRWLRKASYPSVYLLSAYKGLANVLKTSGGPPQRRRTKELSYEDDLKDAEAFQSGWKRTGEIAAKGPWARKWSILRRSAEVWAYFSSFYLKDRRICQKYNSGKWSEEKFKAERSKLGAEVTQNLLRLGPTFIKVRLFSTVHIHRVICFCSAIKILC